MDFILVGSEEDWHTIHPWFLDSQDCHLTGIVSLGEWSHWPENTRRFSDLEHALADRNTDGVIVAGKLEHRAEIVRRAAQSSTFCICFHPVDRAAIVYHEMAMIAADNRATTITFLPARCHPAWRAFRSFYSELPQESIVSVHLSGNCDVTSGSAWEFYAQLADLIQTLEEVVEVTAVGTMDDRIIVQHGTEREIPLEVRLEPAGPDAPVLVVELRTRDGSGTTTFVTDLYSDAFSESIPADEGRVEYEGMPRDLMQLVTTDGSQYPSWENATKAAELAECVRLSLERQRTIEVLHEVRDELASFKGVMTSCGCGLIWMCIFGLFAAAAAKGLGFESAIWGIRGLAIVVVAFMLLQIMRFVFPRAS